MVLDAKEQIAQWMREHEGKLIEVSEKIWDNPELAFHEDMASGLLADMLELDGFTVTRGVANMQTAFLAQYGQGGPVIGFLGEYDALPQMSQKPEEIARAPIVEGGAGHACGHNLLGTGSAAAAMAVKHYMQQNGLGGTVRFYGCPAEEGGSGKAYMARDGLFSDLDAAFSWHPSRYLAPWMVRLCASISAEFWFEGTAAHAASAPHMGRSALDACEIMNIGMNYMREHIPSGAKIHYAYIDAGGTAANIIPDRAGLKYIFRAPTVEEAIDIRKRAEDAARGAALISGTKAIIRHNEGYSDYVPNKALTRVMGEAVEEIGPIVYEEADYELARKIRASLPENCTQSIGWEYTGLGPAEAREYYKTHVLYDRPGKFIDIEAHAPASTDMGDVSHCVPTAQVEVPCYTIGTPNHSWQMTAQTRSSIGQKGMLEAAKCLALCGVKVLQDESGAILADAKQEFAAVMGSKGYECPFSAELMPPR